MADELEWILSEDGSINVNDCISSVIYHPTLNVILVITKESSVKVLDVCAGILLQNCTLSACYKSQVSCTYIPGHDKVLFTDGKSVGLRRDHNGVLLLDTILQTRVSSPNDVVRIELLLSEAVQLLRCLQELDVLGSDQTDEVRTELENKIAKSEVLANGNHKVVKWCSVCLELPHNILKAVFASLVQELKRLNRSVPSLSIASAVSERLNSLLPPAGPPDLGPNGVGTVDRSLMFSEMARRETFGKWPHMNYKWALPDQMAQAGFYHQSNSTGDDRAMCFTCSICLVCWEPTDEPWSEHERHSPSCPFVKGEYTQNVPLSVTNATSPAILHSDRLEKFGSISVSTCPDLVATSTESGSIVVWNVARSLKKEFQFKINLRDPFIVSAIAASRQRQTHSFHPSEKYPKFDKYDSESDEMTESDSTQISGDLNKVDASMNRCIKENDLMVTALAILGPSDCSEAAHKGNGALGDCQPLLIVGASIGAQTTPLPLTGFGAEENPLVQVMNDVNQTSRSLDIMKMEKEVRKASEEGIIGSPHPSSSQENNHNASAVSAASGLYLLHCVLGWQPPRCGNNHGGSGAASGTVSSSSKSTKSACRDTSRLLCQSLGMLLSEDSLDSPYGLNAFVSPPSLVHVADSKFAVNSYTMDHAGIDDVSMSDEYEPGNTEESSQNVALKPAERKPGLPCGHVAGCLELPGSFNGDLYSVSHVVPTLDGLHVLVVVGLNVDDRKEGEVPRDGEQFGALFLYHLERQEEGVALVETPTLQRTLTNPDDVVAKVIVLPEEVREVQDDAPLQLQPDSARVTPLGFVALIARSGLIQIVDLSSLDRVGEMKPPAGTSYIAAAYCASIERICASTSDGNLHFLQLWPKVRGSLGSVAVGAALGPPGHLNRDTLNVASSSKDERAEDQEACQVLVNQPLNFDLLTKLHNLTHFTNLTPRFAATLPTCWSEIQQEQKQRRHPQHLQQQGESNQHTRSWRLQPDSNTWEEHLFEITLPRACCVGHIDFKFNLQPVFSSPPNIQVTLLKQNTNGLGKKDVKAKDSEVDSFISLNIRTEDQATNSSAPSSPNESPNNRVLNPDFLKAHNAEIVCGPLPLSSYIDLSGQSGIVTFTSPALLQTKARTFLIHLKHIGGEKEANNGKREVPSTVRPPVPTSQTSKPPLRWQNLMKLQDKHGPVPSLQSLLEFYVPPGSAIELLAASAPNRKTETPKGCDLFHEISITVRSTKVTHIANERLERLAMLANTSFYERLIAAICSKDVLSNDGTTLEHQQHLALDILNWVAAIQSGGKMEESENASIFPTIQSNLNALIKCCFLDASRSIAHKCSKLIVFCMEFPKELKEQGFDAALLHAILQWLPSVVMCKTAGAMHWFFLLLNRIKFLDSDSVGQECLLLLVNVVQEMDRRTDPLHALLRARFGLYRTPFELELFEVEAPLPPKPTSTPVTYAAVVGNGGGGGAGSSSTNNNNGIHVNSSVVMGASVSSGCPSTALSQAGTASLSEDSQGTFSAFNPPTQQLRGLLEVEPLHFTCHAASDGTKVERVDPGLLSGANNSLAVSPNMTVYVPSTSGIRQAYSSAFTKNPLDPKKIQDDLLKLLQIKQNLTSSFMTNQNQLLAPKGGSKSNSSLAVNSVTSAAIGAATTVAVTPVPVSPWQHFLHPPPQQALVIERMHSGARRFVVLDFGKPIYLTDLMIPSCPDLVSLSIDIWTEGEEVDGQRLVVSTDIWFLSLVMNDLLPPPRCRFLKITAIGRYGMSTTRCRIPMGTFYGHTTPLPWLQHGNGTPEPHAEENYAEQFQMHLNVLSLLLEDIHCRYSLACDKLYSLLGSLLTSDHPISGHVQMFIQREQGKVSDEEQRVFSTYRDCVQLQQQFNLAAATVERLKRTMPTGRSGPADSDGGGDIKRASTDKLRVLSECLLVALLGMTYKPHAAPLPSLSSAINAQVSQPMCELLFRYLAIGGSNRFQAMANALLVRTCGLQPWWGSFVAKMLVELYHSQQTAVFPQDRVFLLLVSCHDKALLQNTLPNILELLQNLLAPITDSDCFMQGAIDLSLVGWVLLFVSFYVDIAESKNNENTGNDESEGAGAAKQLTLRERDSGPSCRWDFIQEEWSMLRNQSNQNKMASHRLYRRKLQKRLMYHKQQLENLEQVKKSYLTPTTTYSTYKNPFSGCKTAMDLDTAAKQHEQLVKKMIKQHTAKHFKDMVQIRRSESVNLPRSSLGEPSTSQDRVGPSGRDAVKELSPLDPRQPPFRLPRGQNLKVAHGLAALLLSMDYTCNVDMFLLTCKVLAKITTLARPAIGLGEIVNQAQLDQLLLRCVGRQGSSRSPFWGGPWAGHAITCLLQDIVEGEKLYPIIKGSSSSSSSSQERPPLNDIGLVEPHIPAAPVASTSAALDDLSPPDSSSSAAAAKTTTDADKMTPMQMQTDATLAGLIKLLDVDSDDTSSDEIPMECNDSFSNIKFSAFPLKKSWTLQNNKSIYFKNSSSSLPRLSPPEATSDLLPISTVSAAVDARLELGVDVGAELRLRTMTFSEADVFFNAFFLPIAPPDVSQSNLCSSCPSPEDFVPEAMSPLHFSAPATSSSVDMLAICFDNLFQKAGMPGSVNLESLLQLWITLNEAASDQMGSILPLSLNAAAGILAALSWHPTLSLRTWYLAFRALQLPQGIHNTNVNFSASAGLSDGVYEYGVKIVSMARAIASDNNLLPAFIKFLSGSGLENAAGSKFSAGPSVCLALCNFVTRLLQVCNNLSTNCKTGLHLKEQLLRVVYILVANNGPIRIGQGPLDAQCRLVNLLLTIRFDGVDSHLQTSVVEAVSSLVHTLIHSGQRVSCRSSTESDISDASCFGGILRVLPRNSTSTTVEVTQSTLVHALLSLCIRLVQSPCGEPVLPPPQPPQPPPQTENTSTPLTDTLKMEQRTSGAAIGQPSGESSRHPQPSIPQTDEHKSAGSGQTVSCTHSHSLSPSPKQQYIADEVLHHQPTMMWLLHSLSACSGSSMAMLLGPMGMGAAPPCPTDGSEKFFLGEPVSVGDLIFQLLCTLNSKASNIMSILQPILAFLSSGISEVGPPDGILSSSPSFMSEPLLWLIMRTLDCEPTISEFLYMGGIQLICKNLVSCHRHQVNTHPSLLSVIMQKVNRLMAPNNGKGTWSNLESVDGLVNFAPLGTITLKDPTIQPADILIQPTPPHRRARTPAWSYHFYPEESWVDLTITLPCAILLKEVHIQPHLTSLATCPSSVALEISSDGSSPSRPLCPPLSTSGLTFIRQQLSPAEIATTVVVRLYKPRDSSNIGLSQILLLGTSAFGDSASNPRSSAIPTEESVAKSSVGWLRLLHHFLIQPCSSETLNGICGVAAAVPGVLQTCCSLLLTPTPELYTTHIELVLLHLGRHSIQVGLEIINILLKMCSSPFGQGNWSHLISRTPTNWATMDSVMDIVFLLCTTRDSSMTNRIGALLDWLLSTAGRALEQKQHLDDHDTVLGIQEPHGIPTQAFIHCFSAILWFLYESGFRSELSRMFSVNTFRLLYDWSACLSSNSNTRRAVNSVFSSICYIRPDYFTLLMEWMGFVHNNPHAGFDFDETENFEAPMTDDSKEIGAAHQVKDSGGEGAIPFSHDPDSLDLNNICLNSDTLSTLAAASQSSQAIVKLIESGLPRLLARAILDFCLHEGSDWTGQSSASFSYSDTRHGEHMTDADKAGCSQDKQGPGIISGELLAVIIQFFTEACGEGGMRDWLGGPEGSSFWLPLLDLLCLPLSHAPSSSPTTGAPSNRLSPQQRTTLESATIQFLSRCCWCHLDNQQLLAQVLCEVISKQSSLQRGGYGVLHSISGFARRLILQLLLENEKILVFVKSCVGLCNCPASMSSHTKHPRFGCGHRFRLIYANTQMTCADILRSITGDSNAFPLAGASVVENRESIENPLKDLGSIGLELVDYLSVAAGVLAKDKRQKVVTKGAVPLKNSQGTQTKTCPPVGLSSLALSSMELVHELLPDQPLPSQLTLAQLLTVLEERGDSLGCPYIVLTVQQSKKIRSEAFDAEGKSPKDVLLSSDGYPSALQIFASVGGLALLAPFLPVLYPDMGKSSLPQASKSNNGDKTVNDLGSAMEDWVKVEAPDEMFDDFPELLAPGTSTPRAGRHGQLSPSVPPHSLAAFGLFLRLPSYAETLLKERQKAQCLLRLALGVSDNGEGGDIFSSPIASTLPTLPFEVLRQLFDSMPLTTDDGVLLRRMALEVGAVHLLLACLSILSHQKVEVPLPGINQELILSSARLGTHAQDIQSKSDDKSHLYWAKGTGFGTGSTAQSWDVEQAISRQKSEEEHVTCLLQVLASYINPRGAVPFHFFANNEEEEIWLDVDSDDEGWGTGDDESANETPQPLLPSVFPELLAQSCVFNTVSSYLRNDSVLDMARHVPLYRALLQLLRAMAVSSQLVGLLLPSIGRRSSSGNDGSGLSICCLLTKMKACVDTYASRLRLNKSKEGGSKSVNKSIPKTKEEEESEGLALLIPDVQETARIVETATARLLVENEELMEESRNVETLTDGGPSVERPLHKTLEERYLEFMKRLQFDTFEMIVEDDEGFRFTVPHHFESNMRAVGDHSHPSRARRLAQEAVTLSTSLPLSYSSSVYVRCDQDRLDLMKVLITGPDETPYANGCFEFDVYFPPDYPNSPMLINLETTGHHTVRFNPNLYNDGKVCLSILNTWHGRPEEKWNPHTSSFLQVLVSIQSLILVQEPYFNEPGYERSRGTPSGQQSSREYDSNIRQATVKWAMLEQMKNTCSCFKEVIHRHFWMKRADIMDQCQMWIAEMEAQGSDRRTGRTVALNCQALKRHFAELKEEFSRMKPPAGLEDIAETIDWQQHSGIAAGSGAASNKNGKDSGSTRELRSEKEQVVAEDNAAAMDGFLQLADSLPDLLPPDEESGSSAGHSQSTSLFCGPI